MPVSDIVDVQITKQTASLTRAGFGTPMILSSEATGLLSSLTKVYGTDVAELVADGFDLNGITAKKFSAIISQNPKVDRIIVAKRETLPLKTLDITPIAKNTTAYSITISGVGPTATAPPEVFTFTTDATATVAEITAGLVALINAGTMDVLATDNTTKITLEKAVTPGGVATEGVSFRYLVNDRSLLQVQNITPDPGVVGDLVSVRTAIDGNDTWYALFLDNSGKAEIEALASNIETLIKLFIAGTSDADVLTSASTDVASVLQSNNYIRTALLWHPDPDNGPGAAWAGKALPSDPGSITWNLLQGIVGVPATKFTTNELGFLKLKNVNRFVLLAGQTAPQEGKTSSGEFIDITRGIDFIQARLEENIFLKLLQLPKISFSDPGISIIENEVRGVMSLGITQSIFLANPAPTVSVPFAADVDVLDKANRLLPDVLFDAKLAGAIHIVEVRGVVSL